MPVVTEAPVETPVETTTPVAEKGKKPKTKKPADKATKNGKEPKVDPAPKKAGAKGEYTDPERESARKHGIRLSQYKVLQWLCKQPESKGSHTYKDIEAGTGYYSCLTADLRSGKDGSLCDKGLVKEFLIEEGGKSRVAFAATAKGRKIFAK